MRKASKSIHLNRETLLQLEQPTLKSYVGGLTSHCDTMCGASCMTLCLLSRGGCC